MSSNLPLSSLLMRQQQIKKSKRSWVRTALHIAGWSCLLWMVSVLASQAFAQFNPSDALQPYRDFKVESDLATRVMEGLLGESYTSPMTVGLTSNTIFGAIFLVFNVIVFAAGTVFASYGVISSIVQTAHEGVVLGKRMSAIWMPIRMVTGIGGLVPAFGGFSLSQVSMLLATSLGISFANFAYDKALDAASTNATLTNPSISRTNPKADGPAMATALFRQARCELAEARKAADHAKEGLPIAEDDKLVTKNYSDISNGGSIVDTVIGSSTIGRAIGNKSDPQRCYAVGIRRKTFLLMDSTGRSSTAGGFRSQAVDYQAINTQAWNGYKSNFPNFVSKVQALAIKYEKEVAEKTGAISFPSDEIRAEGIRYTGAVQGYKTEHSLITKEALSNMKKYGFFGAGSFYAVHAEVNAAVLQAADVTDFEVFPPRRNDIAVSGEYDYMKGDPESAPGDKTPTKQKVGFCVIEGRFGLEDQSAVNATGNCSIGQKIIKAAINAGTAGAGGTGTVVDPIIAMKNIGDYLIGIGETLLIASTAPVTSKIASGAVLIGSAIASVFSGGAAAPAVAMPAFVSTLVLSLGSTLPVVGMTFIVVGALCAIYIPLVPFLTWVSALVQYLCIVVESFAAAPLWAFAHLQSEGEGMGQRTERGYLYLLNLLFRPILMVIAFFAASALVILLGSVVFELYLPTIASAEGNSITGIVSIIGYVFIFFVIMNTIIQGLFHLTSELADDAIGWVGGIGRQNIGKDTEGKVNQLFIAGGRMASGGMTSMRNSLSKDANTDDKSKKPESGDKK